MAAKSKTNVAKDGDRNSKYFHKCASQRRQINTTKRISNDRGQCARSQEDVSGLFEAFYHDHFQSSQPAGIDEIVEDFGPIVNAEMNRKLLRELTTKEIKCAIFEINPLSSPGLDGFSAGFTKIIGV